MANRINQITKQWAAREIELLESPAYRELSLSAHRALSRIEVELAHHGGKDNGKLPVTFDDFEEYGVRRKSIPTALTELETLGFIEVTERGKSAKAAEYRRPNKFRLTTRESLDGVGQVGCRWRQFKSRVDANQALKRAGVSGKNSKCARGETPPKLGATRPHKRQNPRGETPLQRAGETPLLSISREGEPRSHDTAQTTGRASDAETTVRLPSIIDCYLIRGRSAPVTRYAPDAPTHPLESLNTFATPAGAW